VEDSRAAAFFDLDKTLIEGSSAIHFGRAAYKAGVISRRQIFRDLWTNVQYRLRAPRTRAPPSCASASRRRSRASGWSTSPGSGPTS
jgi:hypothetical protein